MATDAAKEYLNVNTVLVTSAFFTWLPLIFIFETPFNLWGVFVKVVSILWLISALRNYFFMPAFEIASIGPGIFFNMVAFSGIWFLGDHWGSYLLAVWIVTNFATIRSSLLKHYTEK
jgi:small basic protein